MSFIICNPRFELGESSARRGARLAPVGLAASGIFKIGVRPVFVFVMTKSEVDACDIPAHGTPVS